MCPEIAKCPLGSKSPSVENDCFRGSHYLCLEALHQANILDKAVPNKGTLCLNSQNMQKHQRSMVSCLSTEALILTSETRSVFQTCIKYLVNLHLIFTYTHIHTHTPLYTAEHDGFIGHFPTVGSQEKTRRVQ